MKHSSQRGAFLEKDYLKHIQTRFQPQVTQPGLSTTPRIRWASYIHLSFKYSCYMHKSLIVILVAGKVSMLLFNDRVALISTKWYLFLDFTNFWDIWFETADRSTSQYGSYNIRKIQKGYYKTQFKYVWNSDTMCCPNPQNNQTSYWLSCLCVL